MQAVTHKTIAAMALMSTVSFGAVLAQSTPAPKTQYGYSLSIFAKAVAGQYTQPDSIAVSAGHVFVGYGDGNAPDGSDGKSTQVVQYSLAGVVEYIYTVPGHSDGLKVDPSTNLVWALQNEDANANLQLIDPVSHTQTPYTFQAPPAAGGGYDDIVFRNGKVYLSASNPANNPNTQPAIVQATLVGQTVAVTPILYGNAQAIDVVTGATVTLNLQDPDSMTTDPSGDLVLTSQGDGELIVVRNPGSSNQKVYQIPLTSPYSAPMVDDSLFTPTADGFILIADKGANTVYALHRGAFTPGSAYSAVQATLGSATVGFVAQLDPEFGLLIPVVTGMKNPGGMAFVSTGPSSSNAELREACQVLLTDSGAASK